MYSLLIESIIEAIKNRYGETAWKEVRKAAKRTRILHHSSAI